jgi:hypothetical protein
LFDSNILADCTVVAVGNRFSWTYFKLIGVFIADGVEGADGLGLGKTLPFI